MAKEKTTEREYKFFNGDIRKYVNFEEFAQSLHLKLMSALRVGHYYLETGVGSQRCIPVKNFKYIIRATGWAGRVESQTWDFTNLVNNLRDSWDDRDPHFYRFWLDQIANLACSAAWCNVYAQWIHEGAKEASKKADQASKEARNYFA